MLILLIIIKIILFITPKIIIFLRLILLIILKNILRKKYNINFIINYTQKIILREQIIIVLRSTLLIRLKKIIIFLTPILSIIQKKYIKKKYNNSFNINYTKKIISTKKTIIFLLLIL